MTIKLEFNMPAEFFGEILDIARVSCEWALTQNTLRTGNPHYVFSFEARPHWAEGKPFHEGDTRNDWQLVSIFKIEAATQKILDGELGAAYKPTRDTIFDAVCEGDTCYIDADCADAILQIAMFGELVFG